jgi:transposase-like protein
MTHRKVYTPEFKQQAVQLALQPGNTDRSVASGLGVCQSALSF